MIWNSDVWSGIWEIISSSKSNVLISWIPDQIDETSSELKNWTQKDLFMIFFPVKAEIPYFSDLNLGGPRGDLRRLYFSICERCQSENFRKIKSFKVKYRFPMSPCGPPNFRSEKYGISAFTGKNHKKIFFLLQFLSKRTEGPSKSTENRDSGVQTRLMRDSKSAKNLYVSTKFENNNFWGIKICSHKSTSFRKFDNFFLWFYWFYAPLGAKILSEKNHQKQNDHVFP